MPMLTGKLAALKQYGFVPIAVMDEKMLSMMLKQ
jgi:hypothetical protein